MGDKGLCFRCDEKYYAEHRCKVKEKREFRMLAVKENGEEWEVLKEYHEESKEMKMLEIKDEGKPIVELYINSMIYLTNPGTMK